MEDKQVREVRKHLRFSLEDTPEASFVFDPSVEFKGPQDTP